MEVRGTFKILGCDKFVVSKIFKDLLNVFFGLNPYKEL
jgi:hypothetical protein